MEVVQKPNAQCLDCNRCSFHGSDYDSIQIHMGTIHPEFCDEMDTGGLGKLVFYQKSARLFHCHRCFFTSKMFGNVYYHILAQHSPEKWDSEKKEVVETKSEEMSAKNSDKDDSENVTSEDEKTPDDQEKKVNLTDVIKSDENDTLTSWPEKVPNQDTQESSDSEFKNRSIDKVSEAKDKESSSDQELLESESSSMSSKLSKTNSVQAKEGVAFSYNDTAASQSKDIPEFSDDDESPALPDGILDFSEDEETLTQPKQVEESSEDEALPDHSKGIEDISEDEMPTEEKAADNISEDEEPPAQSKGLVDSSEEEAAVAKVKEIMDFSEEEDMQAQSKDVMEFSEEEVEPVRVAKNVMEFLEEEETTNLSKNIMEFSEEEEAPGVTKNIMEFSDDEDTPALSKDIMEFSEEEDTASVSKGIMEFSEEEDILPHLKVMPKYLEGNSTPTQSKDNEYAEDVDTSVSKGTSGLSDDESPVEGISGQSKDTLGLSKSESTPVRLAGVLPLPDYITPSWSRDLQDSSDGGGDLTATPDAFEDKDSGIKDEEIMKHVRKAKGKFYCMLCECRPLKKGPILHHLITRHNMPSPFVCKTCGKTFVMETHLKNHLATHTKGLFKCNRCSFQTDHPRGFKKHSTHCQSRHKDDVEKSVLDFQEEPKEEGD
ncbi:chromosome alignment-maintaining phosphoprotein 1 [Pelodytes ibericus]